MGVETFVILLTASAAATSIAVQIVKQILDKLGVTYKSVPLAIVIAAIVGIGEVFIYGAVKNIDITVYTALYAVCMGIANAVGATTDYDLVKKLINALVGK